MGEQTYYGFERADAETLHRRQVWAGEVRTQLAAAGPPVQAEHMDVAVSGGVEVTADPGADEAGGVYVGRHPAPALRTASMRAAQRQDAQDPALRYSGAVGGATMAAIRDILTAGGHGGGAPPERPGA
ncbi:hypothetical protein [Streptomyces sp. NPDC054783]